MLSRTSRYAMVVFGCEKAVLIFLEAHVTTHNRKLFLSPPSHGGPNAPPLV